jgi:hypothetical protein
MISSFHDPATELYELEQSPEPKIIQKLIYEHLIHHCFSDTAVEFGAHCQLEEEQIEKHLDDSMDLDEQKCKRSRLSSKALFS